MTVKTQQLLQVPLFALLDAEEAAVLAEQVEIKKFAARERIYKIGDPGGKAYILISGKIHVTTIDEDHQEVTLDEPCAGDFFGFASLLDETPHQSSAYVREDSVCIEVDRNDIETLLQKKPLAAMDLLATLGRQFHAAERLVRLRALRNSNELIEEEETFGERIADIVARFGGSWSFIISFGVLLVIYTALNSILGTKAVDPYPFIFLNLILSMLAAIQAPVIMMSQNRQDKRDRLRGELDYAVNLRAETEVQGLARKLNLMEEQLQDIKALVKK